MDTYTLRCPPTAIQASEPTVLFSAKRKLDIGWSLLSIWEAQLWGWCVAEERRTEEMNFMK